MHELGVLVHILRTVREAAEDEGVTHVEKICLDVGEVSGVISAYLKMQLPIAVSGQPMFQGCELEIHDIEAKGQCRQCGRVYALKKHKGICPSCQYDDFYTVDGTQLIIREIVAS